MSRLVLSIALLLAGVVSIPARASCVATEPYEAQLEPSSCRVIHPSVESALQRFVSLSPAPDRREPLLDAYRGVLLEASVPGGADQALYFFPARPGLDCPALQRGAPLRVQVTRACCDGDPNAPCLLGTSLRAELVAAAAEPADPSQHPTYRADGRRDQRYRFRADLDGDGIPDLLLSHGISLFGRAGGLFQVFLADGAEAYEEIGSVHLHPRMISLETAPEATRIWTYARNNAQSGTVGFYEIRERRLSEFYGLRVHPGDGGTALGNDLLATVFGAAHRLAPERSEGEADEVRWTPAE